jgi:hypothetical protein
VEAEFSFGRLAFGVLDRFLPCWGEFGCERIYFTSVGSNLSLLDRVFSCRWPYFLHSDRIYCCKAELQVLEAEFLCCWTIYLP